MLGTMCIILEENNNHGHECYSDGEVDGSVKLRRESRTGRLRHALSEVLPADDTRRRSHTMTEAKEYAYGRLQEELNIAQSELKLKDEECAKLLKVRDQIGEELEELTACLFEEANNMVQDANIKRMHTEKLLQEASHQVEVLQAEVVALKQLVLTSTPSSPNKHLHPQIANGEPGSKDKKEKKDKGLKPFWKTHRRSTSHHQFTQEDRSIAEAQHEAMTDRCTEMDEVCFEEFCSWRQTPTMSRNCPFIARIAAEDICTCLNFSNTHLAERVLTCVENNSLAIEPMAGDTPYTGKCQLTQVAKVCKYKVKLGDDATWYCISQHCRNRITAVCDFFSYVRYIQQGLVKNADKDVFYEIVKLRKQMALARLGYV
ncbi:rab-3A-interacting protein-like isoform X2 [Dreissena polymorpha]|uniref:rab-3A-interacting protein-like isoform X2 n=1 Tax=Dreissena polymorpha TaxID=45954 RepID=UPI00226546DF|nr:rab-3A-interacting protein-like isoform X2 [Dreissena polymorpha]